MFISYIYRYIKKIQELIYIEMIVHPKSTWSTFEIRSQNRKLINCLQSVDFSASLFLVAKTQNHYLLDKVPSVYLKNNWSEILILKCLIDTCIEETLIIGCNTFKLKVILYTGKYMPPFLTHRKWANLRLAQLNNSQLSLDKLRQDEIVYMCERGKNM